MVLTGLALACNAGIPAPSFFYYGIVRDAFGNPYTEESEVDLVCLRNGVELSRCCIKDYGAVANYLVAVAVDNSDEPYSSSAVPSGSEVTFVVEDADGEQLPTYTADLLPVVGDAGKYVAADLSIGVDSDGDGLPDEWENQTALTYWLLTGNYVTDLTAAGDMDGDGASNYAEYIAGTSAADEADVFKMYNAGKTENSEGIPVFSMQFFSAHGRSYIVREQLDLRDESTRQAARYSTSMDGDWTSSYLSGSGEWTTVYIKVSTGNEKAFYSLEVK